jgi:hypothetical protein
VTILDDHAGWNQAERASALVQILGAHQSEVAPAPSSPRGPRARSSLAHVRRYYVRAGWGSQDALQFHRIDLLNMTPIRKTVVRSGEPA